MEAASQMPLAMRTESSHVTMCGFLASKNCLFLKTRFACVQVCAADSAPRYVFEGAFFGELQRLAMESSDVCHFPGFKRSWVSALDRL